MRTIVDTGPLVALFNRRDPLHDWAVRTFEEIKGPYFTTEAVLTEVCHFLQSATAILEAWQSGDLVVSFDSHKNRSSIAQFMTKFAPVDFADATIVICSAQWAKCQIITIDRKDFIRFRVKGNQPISLIMPPP